MAAPAPRGRLVAALAAAVTLLLGSVAAVVVASGAVGEGTTTGVRTVARGPSSNTATPVPELPGTIVNVTVGNMGGAMMGRGSGVGGGAMFLRVDRATVRAGAVSFVATNLGSVNHELVVLPLADGATPGSRRVGGDNKVDETGSLGEASNSGGAGAGEGITPGASGWVSLTLAPGRYELVCDIAGHYADGMHAVLTVT
ncbi:sulfocyanin (SoxE) [mine drainage metagenome]|uniref:Sulfocyanin (SoxE) n=1 Tax=mine drainage metagenome TaxID=410659 RepID=A0A1J5R406_9ZZZZ